jgi:hypothetical protein
MAFLPVSEIQVMPVVGSFLKFRSSRPGATHATFLLSKLVDEDDASAVSRSPIAGHIAQARRSQPVRAVSKRSATLTSQMQNPLARGVIRVI